MARAKAKATEEAVDFSGIAKKIDSVPMHLFMEKNFLSYAYMVILSRAIPDARDGLKPVQRRILWTMEHGKYTPDREHVKSARITGDCMALYHPHSGEAIYDAMVRMAQDFSMRLPLVDGFGNFGSPSDGPAASRYTESRMSPAALYMLEETREGTVDMMPNYDSSEEEPTVLPAQFPNLLVNGGSGIAVGMATKIPTHNPTEIINAARWLLTHPNASLEKLMEFVPGPDFPTGGLIIGTDAIEEAYETGRGRVIMRARHHVEPAGRGKNKIIYTEMPYDISIEKVVEEVKKHVGEGKLQGVADIKDLTDRRLGTRLVVESKAGINPDALVAELFLRTSLESTFGVNLTVITPKGEPATLGLKDLLQIFLDHRFEVVRRRTQNRRDKRAARLHLVEGLLKALLDIDKVIKIVRAAPDAEDAKAKLIKSFKLDDIQAEYVLSLQLRRLTKMDQHELSEEKKKLIKEIAELDNILNDEEVLRRVIGDELSAVGKKLATERKTEIVGGTLSEHLEATKEAVTSASVEVADGPTHLSVLASGAVVRSPEPYVVGGRGKLDPIVNSIPTTTRSKVVFVTNKGNGHRVEVLHLSDGKNDAKAVGVPLAKDERIIAVAPDVEKDAEGVVGIAMATRKEPAVKIVAMDFPVRSDEFELMPVGKDDEIMSARYITKSDEAEFVFITSDSSLLHFSADKVRAQGRTGGGVASMKVAADAEILGFFVVTKDELETATVLTVAGPNWKNTPLNLFPPKGRSTGGVRSHKFLKGTTRLDTAFVGVDILAVDAGGKKVNLPAPDPRRDGSGVKIEGEKPALFGRK